MESLAIWGTLALFALLLIPVFAARRRPREGPGDRAYVRSAATYAAVVTQARAAIQASQDEAGLLRAARAVLAQQAPVADAEWRVAMEQVERELAAGIDRLAAARNADLAVSGPTGDLGRTIFERNAAGIFIVDAQAVIKAVNPALCAIFGYDRSDLIGQSAALLHRGEKPFKPFRLPLEIAGDDNASVRFEHRFRRKDGTRLWGQILGAPISLPGEDGAVLWSLIDVSALHLAQEQVHYQAQHDVLTGLPNRRALEQQLPKAIARARRHDAVLAVGVLDLDDFKPVNDTWGHEAGDRLLQEVARRMRARLREADLLTRNGGDEFVVVIEDLDPMLTMQQLGELLARLHQAVESPIDVGGGQLAHVGASLGLALFPIDGQDSDSLLRLADAAMYQSKVQKHARSQWWHRGADNVARIEPEHPFDAYGGDAAALMRKAAGHFDAVTEQFVEVFWNQLATEAEGHAILCHLAEDEIRVLAERQAAHLRFLLDPALSQEQLHLRAAHVGKVHGLVGTGSELMVHALALHRRLLSDHLNRALLPARERYRILLSAETRLQESMQAELRSLADTVAAYLGFLSAPLPAEGSLWPDAKASEITQLGSLPGILGALLMRLNAEGVFNVEGSAGPHGADIASVLLTPGSEAVIDPASPRGQGTSAQAWRTLEIHRSANYSQDRRYGHWKSPANALGLRATVSVPVLNQHGQPVAVVTLFGAYPNQFGSTTMQQFARGLQQRWQQIWLRCSTPAAVLPQNVALDYRQSLFAGGLRMYMQPLIDLRSGAMSNVEALARLERPDGRILAPAVFLPLLGDAELDHLFRMGLDIVLQQLTEWDAAGLMIDASLNLPPSTLLDPDCTRWVAAALERHHVVPRRLTLELLETQSTDPGAQDAAIARLLRLGVQLSMDDLGSGYSSLHRLATLPFDTIKVDQALLARVHDNPVRTLSVINAIVQMGRDFEREVVVEGLEHPAMIEAAAILGAPYGQGYGLARPMPAHEVLGWSRNFHLLRQPGEVSTWLGALAHLWRCAGGIAPEQAGASAHLCPVSAFLAHHAHGDQRIAEWHRRLHAGQDVRGMTRQIQTAFVYHLQVGD